MLYSDLVIHQIKKTVDHYILRDFTKIGHPSVWVRRFKVLRSGLISARFFPIPLIPYG